MSARKTANVGLVVLCALCGAIFAAARGREEAAYHSPLSVAFSPTGKLLAISDHTARALAIADVGRKKIVARVLLRGRPCGVAWDPTGERLWIAEQGAGSVAEVSAAEGTVLRRFSVGPRPEGIAVAPRRSLLLVANSGRSYVSLVDLEAGREVGRIAVPRSPFAIAVSPDETRAVVSNLLPAGRALDAEFGAMLSIIDLAQRRAAGEVRLGPGATLVRGVAVSGDGRWAYAVHTVGRANLPTTHLDRGWVNTNALSIVDLQRKELYATVLLDLPLSGAADPWDVALSSAGDTLWVTLSGVHELARVDLGRLHALLAGKLPKGWPARGALSPSDARLVWYAIARDPSRRSALAEDLGALHAAGALARTALPLRGPRGMDLSPNGRTLAIAGYYSGAVALVDAQSGRARGLISLGAGGKADAARRGEILFHDATLCFQHWLSCSTCHPDGRADGLNWDLLNDGLGNPKNTRSLVFSYKTPPVMSRGVRASMEVASRAGFVHILFREPRPGEVEDVQAYLRALRPERSPYRLPDGSLSPAAERGKRIFLSPRTKCALCHPPPLYTDKKLHDVGTRGPLDHAAEFDTPALFELWRTAPYLHDGSAATLRDVFTTHNKGDRHGVTSHLSRRELAELEEFLLSL